MKKKGKLPQTSSDSVQLHLKPFNFQDLIGNSPYCLTCNS